MTLLDSINAAKLTTKESCSFRLYKKGRAQVFPHYIQPKKKQREKKIELVQTKKTMIHPKKVIDMAKKWERKATFRRRTTVDASSCSTLVGSKGHFVVYTVEKKRFEVPLDYLNSRIFMQLLRISEEEFGLSNDRPIVLPCEAALMEYAMDLIRRKVSKAAQNDLLDSLISKHCQFCCAEVNFRQQIDVY